MSLSPALLKIVKLYPQPSPMASTMRSSFRVPTSFRRAALYALVIAAAAELSGCSSPETRAENYYEHGKQLLATHDNLRAAIEFRNAVKYNKKLLPAWQSLAEVDETTHNYNELVPVLRNVLELDPGDLTARIKLGRLLLIGGAFDDALKLVNDVQGADSQNADLLALKAAVLFKLKDSAGAVTTAQAALKIDPKNTGALFVLAGNDAASGDNKSALEILDSPEMTQGSDVGVQLFKLQILEKTQDLQKAEALLQELIAQHPKETGFKKELVKLYIYQHRNDDAEKEERAIVAADPGNVQNELELVRLLGVTKGPAAAKQELVSRISAGGDTFAYQIALAQLNYAQGDFSDSEAALKKIISGDNSADHVLTARISLAQMYLARKQIDAASALVSDILAKDGRNIAGLKLRASISIVRGQLDGAIADLRQALNDQPRATDLMLLLAVAYERSGSTDLAEKEFADAMRVSDFNPAISLNYVAFLQRRGSLATAEDVATDLATRWPKNLQVLEALAQIRLARQEWAGAQQVAEAIKKLGANNDAAADELLGAAFAGSNKYDDSIAALQDAYAAAPSATQPMYDLVRVYLAAQKPGEAIAFLQSVLKASPSNAEAYVLLGSVQLANKAPDQARQSFMAAIAKQPSSVIGYKALSDLYVSQKNYDAAIQAIRDGLKQQPDNIMLHLALAGTLEASGDFNGAIAENESLLAKDPTSIIVINNLASLLADHRTDKTSLDRAQTLAASLQGSPLPQLKDTVGWVDYRVGNYNAAAPLLEAAVKAMPTLPLIHYHLGMTYAALGQQDKAAEQFKMALDQSPNDDLLQKIHAAQAQTTTPKSATP